jgi:hypothetical protein
MRFEDIGNKLEAGARFELASGGMQLRCLTRLGYPAFGQGVLVEAVGVEPTGVGFVDPASNLAAPADTHSRVIPELPVEKQQLIGIFPVNPNMS